METVKLRDTTAAILRAKGFSVIEDGADGINDPLKKAIVLARKSSLAIEFHFNAATPKATGIEVLSKPNKQLTAKLLATAINKATGLPLRGECGWKADNSGQHPRLAFCDAGGLIVEVCFISNKSDMAAYQKNFAKICEYIAEVLSRA